MAAFDSQFTWRVHTALWGAETALRVDGDFVECGVNAGAFCHRRQSHS